MLEIEKLQDRFKASLKEIQESYNRDIARIEPVRVIQINPPPPPKSPDLFDQKKKKSQVAKRDLTRTE